MRRGTRFLQLLVVASAALALAAPGAALAQSTAIDSPGTLGLSSSTKREARVERHEAAASSAGLEDAGVLARGQRQPARRQPQQRRAQTPRGPAVRFQAFGEVAWDFFAASNSFDAVLGSSSGLFVGGGARVSLRGGLFGQVDVSRFEKDGSRVFVANGEVFPLGIPTTITMRPIDITVGVEARATPRSGTGRRPGPPGARARATAANAQRRAVAYYVGGGVGLFGYRETAQFAAGGEDADDQFRSYHVMGGVHVPVWSVVGVGFDVQRRWVKDAIGTAGVSQAFEEDDLGGITLRVRFTIGQ